MANRTTKSKATRSSKNTSSKKSAKATRTAARKPRARASVSAAETATDLRRQMIAKAAYLRAQQRGFGSGDPLDDWLAAEREVDAQLTKSAHPSAN
jgi:hypothetical protein